MTLPTLRLLRGRSLGLLACALLGACNDGGTGAGPSPDMAGPPIGTDQSIKILDAVTHKGGEVVKGPFTVALPAAALYSSITLHIQLDCPPGGCDPYDRIASIRIPKNGTVERIEVARYITPFGVKGSWDVDVTDLAPVLAGMQTFESYIETYAGGWVVTATLNYKGGIPEDEPVFVQPLAWDRLPVGDAAKPIDTSLPPASITLGNGATYAKVRLHVTGHGQGNSENCAEFCDLNHSLLFDGNPTTPHSIWRGDCDQNPISNQRGSWQYAREGWCPGADVKPWVVGIGTKQTRVIGFNLGYAVPVESDNSGAYVNTCQPNNCQSRTCAFGNPCAYDGGAHTEPNFFISAVVIGYR